MPGTSTSETPTLTELSRWLEGGYPGGDDALARRAREVMEAEVGRHVSLRGLLEFSNRCSCDCYYCGIRKSARLHRDTGGRFTLEEGEIIEAAKECLAAGFGSMTLQSGERRDEPFIRFLEGVIRRIKRETRTSLLPEGLGITLCVGRQSREVYRRLYEAGAHRYLLRVETTNEQLFSRLHPPQQRLESRIRALKDIKETGFQLGTGVMIGIPGQSAADLARDVAFFREIDADMIGMGPYLESSGLPPEQLAALRVLPESSREERLQLSLRMIAVTRIYLRDINIAATTALQAVSPTGREAGLSYGANVLMPIVTPGHRRRAYQLYEGKPWVDEDSRASAGCTPGRAARIGRPVALNRWGDAPHAGSRRFSA